MSEVAESTVKPALTAEEWRFMRVGSSYESRLAYLAHSGDQVVILEPLGVEGEERHGLAALCLHEQPFGFTRDDVIVLRQLPAFLSGAGMGSDPDGASVYVRNLADRIEALLPPEPSTTLTGQLHR